MTYRLTFAPSFEADVQEKIDWLHDQGAAERAIEAWFVKLFRQLESITVWPRCYRGTRCIQRHSDASRGRSATVTMS
jgi:plasmid stabilization system protein ParE